MTAAVLPSSSAPFHLEKYLCWEAAPPPVVKQWKADENAPLPASVENNEEEEERPGQIDIWNAIQSQKANSGVATADPPAPYVHPLLRRSSSLLSQKSLEVCTESLGSETGSDDFSSSGDDLDYYNFSKVEPESKEEQKPHEEYMHDNREVAIEGDYHSSTDVRLRHKGKELTSVNYHCSISTRSPRKSYPPPLTSISRQGGPCVHMRPHRRGGRLVVEAVPVPSQNYLHAQREGGRLLLSFIDATFDEPPSCFSNEKHSEIIDVPQNQEQAIEVHEEEKQEMPEENEAVQLSVEEIQEKEENNCHVEESEEESEEGSEEEEEEEEEVEVVDRGTVVEVKVSTQPQQQSSAAKVLRSSVVINKFVGDTPVSSTTAEPDLLAAEKNENKNNHSYSATTTLAAPRRAVPTTTTTAAAVVAASTLGVTTGGYSDYYGYGAARGGSHHQPSDNKLLFTSKRRNREELLHNMRRCSQLRRPLFIWEPYCIATSS